jgi:hypothetical protein
MLLKYKAKRLFALRSKKQLFCGQRPRDAPIAHGEMGLRARGVRLRRGRRAAAILSIAHYPSQKIGKDNAEVPVRAHAGSRGLGEEGGMWSLQRVAHPPRIPLFMSCSFLLSCSASLPWPGVPNSKACPCLSRCFAVHSAPPQPLGSAVESFTRLSFADNEQVFDTSEGKS